LKRLAHSFIVLSPAIVALAIIAGALNVLGGPADAGPLPSGVHYKNPGVNCQPISGGIRCSGTVVGLGNQTVVAHLDLAAETTITCTMLTSANNNLDFSLSNTVQNPTFANAKQAGCPNNNWTYNATTSFSGSYSLYWCFGNQLISNLTVISGPSAPTPRC
jgi:hypothetical protein